MADVDFGLGGHATLAQKPAEGVVQVQHAYAGADVPQTRVVRGRVKGERSLLVRRRVSVVTAQILGHASSICLGGSSSSRSTNRWL